MINELILFFQKSAAAKPAAPAPASSPAPAPTPSAAKTGTLESKCRSKL